MMFSNFIQCGIILSCIRLFLLSALFKLCDKAGISRFSMHVLRHTMATRSIEGGIRPKTLQVILSHSSVEITMNLYVHVTEDEKVKEVEKIENALNVV